jgi:hypothetical protein
MRAVVNIPSEKHFLQIRETLLSVRSSLEVDRRFRFLPKAGRSKANALDKDQRQVIETNVCFVGL